ncbi:MAG: hypothetical protein AAF497_19325 [Planctomycetota bacterium]
MSRTGIIVVGLSLVTLLTSADAQIMRRRARRRAFAPRPANVWPEYYNQNSIIYEEVVEQSTDDSTEVGENVDKQDAAEGSKSQLVTEAGSKEASFNSDAKLETSVEPFSTGELATDQDTDTASVSAKEQTNSSATSSEAVASEVVQTSLAESAVPVAPVVPISTEESAAQENTTSSYESAVAFANAIRQTESSTSNAVGWNLRWLFLLIPVYCAWLVWMSVRADQERYAPLLDRMGGTGS